MHIYSLLSVCQGQWGGGIELDANSTRNVIFHQLISFKKNVIPASSSNKYTFPVIWYQIRNVITQSLTGTHHGSTSYRNYRGYPEISANKYKGRGEFLVHQPLLQAHSPEQQVNMETEVP